MTANHWRWPPATGDMPTIAVTGASGFIGKRLIEHLRRDGVSVRALSRKTPVRSDAEGGELVVVEGALGDDAAITELIEGVDAVVHLAGLIKARTRNTFFEANADGTRHLVGLMAASRRPPKLVLVSSLAAREPHLSSYAASKRAAEDALHALDGTLPWTILRPPAVYGPGDRATFPFFQGIKRGFGAMLGDERARFSLLHVDDLTALMQDVLDPAVADQSVLEPDDGEEGGHGWHGMIDAGAHVFERRVFRFRVPTVLLALIAHGNAALRILPGYTPMLTPEKIRELTHPNWVADRRSILSETDWKPTIPLDRGFPATVDWYRLHSWL